MMRDFMGQEADQDDILIEPYFTRMQYSMILEQIRRIEADPHPF